MSIEVEATKDTLDGEWEIVIVTGDIPRLRLSVELAEIVVRDIQQKIEWVKSRA